MRRSPAKRKPLPLASQDNIPQVRLESPTSITMKNSFLIKNADPSFDKCYAQIKKRSLDKTSIDRDDAAQTSKTPGKRPPARDGHTGLITGNKMIVFGGDRHHMPFNDFHVLDLQAEVEDKRELF